MTAINVVTTAEAVHVFTDTAVLFHDAQLCHAVKCLPVPHLNLVVATRGPAKALPIVHNLVSFCPSFKHVRETIAFEVKAARTALPDPAERSVLAQDIDIIIAGYDGCPRGFVLFTHERHGVEAWKGLDVSELFLPSFDIGQVKHLRGPMKGYEALLQQAKQLAEVGGFVQETIVDAIGIRTRCLGRMEQRAGKPFAGPEPTVSLPLAFAAHLSAEKRNIG